MNLSPSNGNADGYKLPPQTIVDIINAQPEPSVIISPDGRGMLLIEVDAMPDIADLARPMDRLAGLRIDPHANTTFRSRYRKGLLYQSIDPAQDNAGVESKPQRITTAESQPKIGLVKWSHNSHDFAFTVLTDSGTALYLSLIHI